MTTRSSSQQAADTMPELSDRDILLKLSTDMAGIKSDMQSLKNDVTDKALCFLFKTFVENIVVLVMMIFQFLNSTT